MYYKKAYSYGKIGLKGNPNAKLFGGSKYDSHFDSLIRNYHHQNVDSNKKSHNYLEKK